MPLHNSFFALLMSAIRFYYLKFELNLNENLKIEKWFQISNNYLGHIL
jgi:hypothetical protein